MVLKTVPFMRVFFCIAFVVAHLRGCLVTLEIFQAASVVIRLVFYVAKVLRFSSVLFPLSTSCFSNAAAVIILMDSTWPSPAV